MSTVCTFCSGSEHSFRFETKDIFNDEYKVLECNHCNSYFLSPQPTPEALERAYSDDYYGDGDQKFNGFVERVLRYFRGHRARLLHGHLKGTGRVLDIGCGNGEFLSYLSTLGEYEIHGIEMPGKAAERARQVNGLHLKTGTLQEDDFEENSFDAITLFHVFEHLDVPAKTLEIIGKILKPGGILIMSFPNIESYQAKTFKGNWLHLDPPRHLFFMGPQPFKKVMQDQGYSVIRERYFSPEYNPFGMQQSMLNQWSSKRDVLYEKLKGNKEYTRGISPAVLGFQYLFFLFSFPLFTVLDLFVALNKQSATVEFVLQNKHE